MLATTDCHCGEEGEVASTYCMKAAPVSVYPQNSNTNRKYKKKKKKRGTGENVACVAHGRVRHLL